MGTKHKHYDVIVAWANGEDIEFTSPYVDGWKPLGPIPLWDNAVTYRIKPKRVKKEGWVNVYSGNASGVSIYANKKEADFWAREHRVDCVHIEWEEEQ